MPSLPTTSISKSNIYFMDMLDGGHWLSKRTRLPCLVCPSSQSLSPAPSSWSLESVSHPDDGFVLCNLEFKLVFALKFAACRGRCFDKEIWFYASL